MSRPWQRGTWSWVRRGARIVTGLVLVAVLAGLAVEVGLAPLARAGRPAPAPVISVSSRSLGRVSPYLFGANLLWPYDADGTFDASVGRFYPAFVDEVKALGVTALRYPAGITSDSFDWQRAIGPERERLDNEPYGMQSVRSKRCCNLDRPVPSTVGPDEFGRLLGQLKAVGTITVNFATGTATEAADWVAYMTAPYVAHPSTSPSSPSYWAALRDKNGHRAPYDVPYWEVGNEQDGPGQFGWRSGRAVSVGDHHRRCKRGTQAVCLYAFGGTTAFSRQLVGRFADEKLVASLSSGRPQQHFYLYYPPVVPGSQTVYVAGRPWSAVHTLTSARAGAHVYAFDPTTGEITFGNGRHGAIPARGAEVTASYESGPHAGFVEFYDAMKRMNPHISVCEAEESNTVFLQLMGRHYRYDCVEVHKYAKPLDTKVPMERYEQRLMAFPIWEGEQLSELQGALRHYAGRNVPIVLSEYGQLVAPMPVADRQFNLSLDEGLLVASQLMEWTDHGLPVAEKYLLDSTPFLGKYALSGAVGPAVPGVPSASVPGIDERGLSVDSAMIAGPGPLLVIEPTGWVLRLMSELAGGQRLATTVAHDPVMSPGSRWQAPVLETVAARRAHHLYLVVLNTSPTTAVATTLDLGSQARTGLVLASVLDGPNPLAYNTRAYPSSVTVVSRFRKVPATGRFGWTFPAHSLSVLQFRLGARGSRMLAPVRHGRRLLPRVSSAR